ncbi:MAG: hypothetical protein RLZZ629_805, partial [Actinomycetota bacterium]
MNKLSNLNLTIKINKPVDEVWQSLVDWKSQSKWMLQTKVWSELDQDRTVKNGKGVLIFAFTGIFRVLMVNIYWKPWQTLFYKISIVLRHSEKQLFHDIRQDIDYPFQSFYYF